MIPLVRKEAGTIRTLSDKKTRVLNFNQRLEQYLDVDP
jgi:hypothetical protein